MALTFTTEKFEVANITVTDEYTVRVFVKHVGVSSNGTEVLISDNMSEVLVPGTDSSGDEWYCTDEVRAVCEAQWDEETIAEWNAMDEYSQEGLINSVE